MLLLLPTASCCCSIRAPTPVDAHLPPTAGIAAIETLKLLGAAPSCGVGLRLHKGLPLGSGMGSSAASAAAAAWAVNSLFGCPVRGRAAGLRLLAADAAAEAVWVLWQGQTVQLSLLLLKHLLGVAALLVVEHTGLFPCLCLPQVPKDRLIYAGLASEAAVSGYHADNIAPALMGGFILIR